MALESTTPGGPATVSASSGNTITSGGFVAATADTATPTAAFGYGDDGTNWRPVKVGPAGVGSGMLQVQSFTESVADSETPLGAGGLYQGPILTVNQVTQWIIGNVAADQAGTLRYQATRGGGTTRYPVRESIAAGDDRQFGAATNGARSDGWRINIGVGPIRVEFLNGGTPQGSFTIQANGTRQ